MRRGAARLLHCDGLDGLAYRLGKSAHLLTAERAMARARISAFLS